MQMSKKSISLYLSLVILLALSLIYVTKEKVQVVGQCVTIPIFCYHDILPKEKIPEDKYGPNDVYTITTYQFETDLKYLLSRGYTPIAMSDYLANSYNGQPLNSKMFVITIDDGNKSNLLYTLPILEKYNVPATLCLIGDLLDSSDSNFALENPYAQYLSSDDIKKLAKSPLIEFASHSNTLHHQNIGGRRGTLMLEGETPSEYRKALIDDLAPFKQRIEELTGKPCNVFAFPFGYVNISSIPTLKESGFQANLMLGNRCTYYYGNEQELQQQYRFLRTNEKSTYKYFREVVGIEN